MGGHISPQQKYISAGTSVTHSEKKEKNPHSDSLITLHIQNQKILILRDSPFFHYFLHILAHVIYLVKPQPVFLFNYEALTKEQRKKMCF